MLVICVLNQAGLSHQKMLQLQQERGPNFLFHGNSIYTDVAVRESGSSTSTFLGVDEVRRYTDAIGGSASITFGVDTVETVLKIPAEAQQTTAHPEAPDTLSTPSSDVVYVLADDDGAQRHILNAIIRKSGGHPDSVVLGSSHEEVASIPSLIRSLGGIHGEERIVVILDQNMDTWPGQEAFYGSSIIKQLGGVNFKGVLCLRTGQDDPESISMFKALGAKLIFLKSGKHMKPAVILDEIAKVLETAINSS